MKHSETFGGRRLKPFGRKRRSPIFSMPRVEKTPRARPQDGRPFWRRRRPGPAPGAAGPGTHEKYFCPISPQETGTIQQSGILEHYSRGSPPLACARRRCKLAMCSVSPHPTLPSLPSLAHAQRRSERASGALSPFCVIRSATLPAT